MIKADIQNILFDLDGTLSNTEEGIVKSVQYALADFSIKEEDTASLRRFIGPPLRESFCRFYGMTTEEAERAVRKYRERYETVGVYEDRLFDGVPEMLSALRRAGKRLAVATSKPTVFAKKVLQQHGIEGDFDLVVGAELDGRRDAKEEVIAEALRLLNIGEEARKHTVMVGDRSYDLNGGRAFGLKTVGLRLGFAAPGELKACQPDFIAADIAELTAYLLGEQKQNTTD